jgi:hypothetical protein
MMATFRIIHDRRGATALEFMLILFPLLIFIFCIIDASRYALTWYSVSELADEAMRQQIICYSPLIAGKVKTVTCPLDPLPTLSIDQMKKVAPALFWGSLTDQKVTTASTATGHAITASVSGFRPVQSLIPISYQSKLTVIVNLPF